MQHYGHYIFPNPSLFIHPATAMKYLGSWLRVCDAWFMHVAIDPSLALSNQSWHMFLSIDDNVPEKGETKAVHCRQETLDIILPNPDMYPRVEKQSSLLGPIVWQGREYPPGVLPPQNVLREILWELYKVNFIHELQSLDCRTCNNLDLLSATQLFERQIQILQCFPTSSFRHVPTPSQNIGLADDDFDKRIQFVTQLVLILVMNSWKEEKPDMMAKDLSNLSQNAAMDWRQLLQNITVNNSSIISDMRLKFLTASMRQILSNITMRHFCFLFRYKIYCFLSTFLTQLETWQQFNSVSFYIFLALSIY